MLQAMFSGVSGLQAHETKLNVIGNNIANVNTIGFKAGSVSFQDQLSQTLRSDSGPGSGAGGQNPAQVGLGVSVGAIDTNQAQGNLQLAGKNTDLAIQGGGFFVVASGTKLLYTRDGSFDLDSSGALVSPATGSRLLGYAADATGAIDASQPITTTSTLQIPIGKLASSKQTDNLSFSGNLDAAAALVSTKLDYAGNLDGSAAGTATLPSVFTQTVYDSFGNAHSVETLFTNPVDNPTGAGVPAGATRSWNVQVKIDGTVMYDSSIAGASKLYRAGGAWQFADAAGNPLGASISLDGAAGANHGALVPGSKGAPAFPLSLNLGALSASPAQSSISGAADGRTGSLPTWTTSVTVYDSLGVGHSISFKYTRVSVQPGDPAGVAARWDWTATENGKPVGDSTNSGNSPLFFDTGGKLAVGRTQTISIPAAGGSAPFTVKVDNTKLNQLASDANVAPESQDGFPAGTLQSFTVSPDGVITGVFSNGQTRPLGQVALGSFSNPSGLEKIGNNFYQESTNSGFAQIGSPGAAGRGNISPGYLEQSNVDLSAEFTNLIITQRGFQANTKIVSVVDQLLQDVITLKQ